MIELSQCKRSTVRTFTLLGPLLALVIGITGVVGYVILLMTFFRSSGGEGSGLGLALLLFFMSWMAPLFAALIYVAFTVFFFFLGFCFAVQIEEVPVSFSSSLTVFVTFLYSFFALLAVHMVQAGISGNKFSIYVPLILSVICILVALVCRKRLMGRGVWVLNSPSNSQSG